MIEITLKRKEVIAGATIGELCVAGTSFRCYTLEDLERDLKIAHKTAIPVGRYPMRVTWSPRFKRYTLEIFDVPNFKNVRIHAGNTKANSSGCPLVGWVKEGDRILRSRLCENALTAICQQFEKESQAMFLIVQSVL